MRFEFDMRVESSGSFFCDLAWVRGVKGNVIAKGVRLPVLWTS